MHQRHSGQWLISPFFSIILSHFRRCLQLYSTFTNRGKESCSECRYLVNNLLRTGDVADERFNSHKKESKAVKTTEQISWDSPPPPSRSSWTTSTTKCPTSLISCWTHNQHTMEASLQKMDMHFWAQRAQVVVNCICLTCTYVHGAWYDLCVCGRVFSLCEWS